MIVLEVMCYWFKRDLTRKAYTCDMEFSIIKVDKFAYAYLDVGAQGSFANPIQTQASRKLLYTSHW